MNLEQTLERALATARRLSAERQVFQDELSRTERSKSCPTHPNVGLAVDLDESWRASFAQGVKRVVHTTCPRCEEETWLASVGVPRALVHCTLANWKARTDAQKANLAAVIDYESRTTGVLQIIGPVGTGKSHLAIGLLRAERRGMFITHSTLLLKLRQTYRDNYAEDIIAKCKRSAFLILDELGISGGGRDELPMLHEILHHRLGEKKRTVLTGNYQPDQLLEIVGERVLDRLREATFKMLVLDGASERKARRPQYLSSTGTSRAGRG